MCVFIIQIDSFQFKFTKLGILPNGTLGQTVVWFSKGSEYEIKGPSLEIFEKLTFYPIQNNAILFKIDENKLIVDCLLPVK